MSLLSTLLFPAASFAPVCAPVLNRRKGWVRGAIQTKILTYLRTGELATPYEMAVDLEIKGNMVYHGLTRLREKGLVICLRTGRRGCTTPSLWAIAP